MGGEKVGGDAVQVTALESPPRGRGKGGLKKPLVCGIRITPAWAGKDSGTVHGCGQLRITPALAGKSREIPLHLRAAKDHPRVGGEKVGPVC